MAKKERRTMRKQTERNQSMWKQFCKKANIGSISAAAGVAALGIALLCIVFIPQIKKATIEQGNVQEVYHTHQPSCYTEVSVLTCTKEENKEHSHVQDCYETRSVLFCALEEHEEEGLVEILEDTSLQNAGAASLNEEGQDVQEEAEVASATESEAQGTAEEKPSLEKQRNYQKEAERLIQKARNAYANQSTKWNTAIIEKTISNTTQNKTETKPQPAQTENQSIIIGGGSDAVEFGGNGSSSATSTINPSGSSSSSSSGSNTETKTITTFKKGVDLSALFVSWCIKEAEVSTWSLDEDSYVSGSKVSEVEDDLDSILHYAYTEQLPEGRLPVAGELVFVDENVDGVADLVGIITSVKNDRVSYLTANTKGEVVEAVETIGEDTIFAYGVLDNAFLNEFEEYYDVSYLADDAKTYLADLSNAMNFPTSAIVNDVGSTTYSLTYKDKKTNQWVTLHDAGLDGDEEFKLTVNYIVGVDKIVNAADNALYVKLPAFMVIQNDENTPIKTSDSTPVGVLNFSDTDAEAVLKFETAKFVSREKVEGAFDIMFKMDFSLIDIDKDGNVGGIFNGAIKFDNDAIAKSGKIDIAKVDRTTGSKNYDSTRIVSPNDASYKLKETPFEGKCYIECTLTATAPNSKLTMPNVKVIDQIDEVNREFVLQYYYTGSENVYYTENTDPTKENFAAPKTNPDPKTDAFVWDIGSMGPNSTKTLTYFVILDDSYVGYSHSDRKSSVPKDEILSNNAKIYAKQFERGEDSVSYFPKAELEITKNLSTEPTMDAEGNYYFKYTVEIYAPATNSYTMTNVKLNDEYKPTGIPNNQIRYLRNQNGHDNWVVKEYLGTGNNKTFLRNTDYSNGVIRYDGQPASNPYVETQSVVFFIGDLEPGHSKVIEYQVMVDKDAMVSGQSTVKKLGNKAQAYDDELKSPYPRDNPRLKFGQIMDEAEVAQTTLQTEMWNRKVSGTAVEGTINITGNNLSFYAPQGDGWTASTNPGSFTVPANTTKYRVVVNEGGDWNVSNTVFQDNMTNGGSAPLYYFTGWARVDVFNDPNKTEIAALSSDNAVANYFEGKQGEAVKTVWMKLGGNGSNQTAFNFKPSQIGLNYEDAAYLITYYAEPNVAATNYTGTIRHTNQFSMTGIVGNGGKELELKGIYSSLSKNVVGQHAFSYSKNPWFYLPTPAEGSDKTRYANGEMYWFIVTQVTAGNVLPAGVSYKDVVDTDSAIYEDGIVGMYIGDNNALSSNLSLAAFENKVATNQNNLVALEKGTDYSVQKEGNDVVVNILHTQSELDPSKRIYMIVKSTPKKLPQDLSLETKTYGNEIYWKNADGEEYSRVGQATQNISATYPMEKEGRGAYEVTETNPTTKFYVLGQDAELNMNELPADSTEMLSSLTLNGADYTYTKNGIYLSWLVTAYTGGARRGDYTIVDSLPENTEVAYVRTYSAANLGDAYTDKEDSTKKAVTGKATFTGWKENTVVAKRKNGTAEDTVTYYYTKDNQVLIYIPELVQNNAENTLYFQVVCKATNTDDRLDVTEKEYVNQVALYSGKQIDGRILKTTAADLQLSYPSMTKQVLNELKKDEDGKTILSDQSEYSFEIESNPFAEDLDPNSDTLVLYDRMGKSLILQLDTLKVFQQDSDPDTKTDITDQCPIEYNDTGSDENVLKITVPDKAHIIIQYDTILMVKPGQNVGMDNIVHWEGKDPGNSTKVEFDIQYIPTASVSDVASLVIRKYDSGTKQSLAGAEFLLYEVDCEDENQTGGVVERHITRDNLGEPVLLPESKTVLGATDGNGEIHFSVKAGGEGVVQLLHDHVYCLIEEKSPNGYRPSTEKFYFVIRKYGSNIEITGYEGLDRWIDKADNRSELIYQIGNTRSSARIRKVFGDNITAATIEGDYYFGIWPEDAVTKDGNGNVTAVNTVRRKDIQRIIYSREEAEAIMNASAEERENLWKDAQFLNLEIIDGKGKTYYIFELDKNYQPILQNNLVVAKNNHAYQVVYDTNRIVAPLVDEEEPVIQATNSIYSLSGTKRFADATGNILDIGVTGRYSFGLWPEKDVTNGIPNAGKSPVQRLTVAWDEEDTDASKNFSFEGLLPGEKYYIFELRQDGLPILPEASATISGTPFFVTYSDKNVLTVPKVANESDLTITNTAIISLPDTGGTGTGKFRMIGLVMMVLAATIYGVWSKKMKMLKLFLLFAICVGLGFGGFDSYAAEPPYVITITNDQPNHEFSAYQIFGGVTASTDGVTDFSQLQWGAGIDKSDFIKSLKADPGFGHYFTGFDNTNPDPAGVAERIALTNKLQVVAAYAYESVTTPAYVTSNTKDTPPANGVYTLTVNAPGYYLILDNAIGDLSATDSISHYFMLKVVDNVTIAPKNQANPTMTKKVVDNNDSAATAFVFNMDSTYENLEGLNWIDAADHDVNDTVLYRIKITLPSAGDEMTGEGGGFEAYKNYKIQLTDTVSPGLTIDNSSIRLFIGGREIEQFQFNQNDKFDGNLITESYPHITEENNVISLLISNVKAAPFSAKGGETICLYYNCILNQNAVIGDVGNPNTVKMVYSNDPKDENHTGSIEDTNVVFTYSLLINKVDGDNNGAPLPGANFRLDKLFASYIVKVPTGNVAFYDSDFNGGKGRIWFDIPTAKYYKNTVTKEVVKETNAPGGNWELIPTKEAGSGVTNVWVETKPKNTSGTTFSYSGIDDGSYLLTETVTPTNYNSIDPITFQVVSTKAQDPARPELTGLQVTGEGGLVLQGFVVDKTNNSNSITATIQNSKGSRLPSTGGSGTTLIYILGILLVVGAGAALVVKTRMDRK